MASPDRELTLGGSLQIRNAVIGYTAVDVVGSLLHASLHAGLGLGRGTDAFLNLRYLGGGASGTSHDPGSDGSSANWRGSVPLSLGATVR